MSLQKKLMFATAIIVVLSVVANMILFMRFTRHNTTNSIVLTSISDFLSFFSV